MVQETQVVEEQRISPKLYDEIIRDLRRCPKIEFSAPIVKNVLKFLDGEWSANDLVESVIDEVSSAYSKTSPLKDDEVGAELSYGAVNELVERAIKFMWKNPTLDVDQAVVHMLATVKGATSNTRRRIVLELHRRGY